MLLLFDCVSNKPEPVVFYPLKASSQIEHESKKSSSIILALTDGKLQPYIHELTEKEVSFVLLNDEALSILFNTYLAFQQEAIFSRFYFILTSHLSIFFFSFSFCLHLQPVAHCWAEVQANKARKYGARIYCVGIKDFDEQQVSEL